MIASKFVSYEKVLKCIDGSETVHQWVSSLRMIQLHFKMYKDDYLDKLLRERHSNWLSEKVEQDKKK